MTFKLLAIVFILQFINPIHSQDVVAPGFPLPSSESNDIDAYDNSDVLNDNNNNLPKEQPKDNTLASLPKKSLFKSHLNTKLSEQAQSQLESLSFKDSSVRRRLSWLVDETKQQRRTAQETVNEESLNDDSESTSSSSQESPNVLRFSSSQTSSNILQPSLDDEQQQPLLTENKRNLVEADPATNAPAAGASTTTAAAAKTTTAAGAAAKTVTTAAPAAAKAPVTEASAGGGHASAGGVTVVVKNEAPDPFKMFLRSPLFIIACVMFGLLVLLIICYIFRDAVVKCCDIIGACVFYSFKFAILPLRFLRWLAQKTFYPLKQSILYCYARMYYYYYPAEVKV